MKNLIFILITIFQIYTCEEQNIEECHMMLERVFNEKLFYNSMPGQLNLTGRDSIIILDEELFLRSCSNRFQIEVDSTILNNAIVFEGIPGEKEIPKKIIIRNIDTIPLRIRSYRASLDDYKTKKFKCYFVLKNLEVNSDRIAIYMEKLITNESIKLEYEKLDEKWKLIKKEIGKY